jgi:hypothetical protein
MFGPIRANQLLGKIAEQQAKAKGGKGGQIFVDEGEAVVRMELFNELATIVAEQAKEIEQLKSYVNQRLTVVAESREREV